MVRKQKSGASRRKVSRKKSSTSNSGPADSALSYRGPIVSRSEWAGDDKEMFSFRVPASTSVSTTDAKSIVFLNDLSDVSGLTDLPPIFSVYNQYRILAIAVEYNPANRYGTSGFSTSTGYANVFRGVAPPTASPADYLSRSGTRIVSYSDPWLMGKEYRGSSYRCPSWKAKGALEMGWKNINGTGDSAIFESGGIAIYIPISVSGGTVSFIVTYLFQFRDTVNDQTPILLSKDESGVTSVQKAPAVAGPAPPKNRIPTAYAPGKNYFKNQL